VFSTKHRKPVITSEIEIELYSYLATVFRACDSRQFFTALGLPNHVVNQLYKKPMTVHLNVRVSSRLVSFAQIQFSVRAMGN
jgi:hypothetical protein